MTDLEQMTQETPAPEADQKPAKPKKSFGREVLEWVVTIIAAVAIAFVVRTFLFEPVRVDGNSMYGTLLNGEIMLVTKPEYLLGDPERFDVVICHYPDRGNTNFVKRVVGLPGDTVAVKDGYLYVNGEKYEEEYLVNRPNYTLADYVVPEGMYFVLGDNRSNSNDSHLIGPITRDMIKGHVRHVVFPFGNWRAVE
ncbi:MAG: signal peptidase I [Clostridia bacterium]|nr:signal peptidase I [Clostridia bacterium]